MAYPERLAALRKARSMTQQSLAEKTGIHVVQIRRYEAGVSQPTLDAIRKLALALNVSADALVFDEKERDPVKKLKLHFEAVAQLPPEQQETIIELIDGMLLKHEAQRWTRPRRARA
ncbi:MAG: helix-turn-helix transcriptional regulator [Xanthomonadales bacterium]|nr:helix-turn-helix transcriptional regulator [Xanthomonadales bacterium]